MIPISCQVSSKAIPSKVWRDRKKSFHVKMTPCKEKFASNQWMNNSLSGELQKGAVSVQTKL